MAGLPNGQRYEHQQSVPRPGIQSHTSSSVPSTPHQRPLDYSRRRSSNTPSPSRTLGNHSPRSVVSEAVAHGSHNSARDVCKFEEGAEIRKRRMPYIDGGEQELGPPKKEPRKTLNPDENDKLSGDMRELYDRLLPSQESEERRAKLVRKLDRILNEEWPGNDIRVNVFGSSGNLLSSTDSDVDICITTPLKKLESMHALAGLLHKHGMTNVICRAAAKVPIVKCWDPELELASDLNVNNPLALQNTRLIKTYVQLDDRVRPLAKIIKYWTKRRILNDAAFGATISSYTWICLIISFLQRREPPILPSLQKITGCRLPSDTGIESPFADDVDALKGFGESNKESLGELLFQFFRHYGFEFEYSKYVVSIKEGRLLSRQEKGWDPSNARQDKEARHRLCVEEPFTIHRNLANTADDYAWHGIHLEIRRAFECINNLKLEECCEEFQFPKHEAPNLKATFQKPPPKPKPTLTRSASQSGQSNREPGSTRSRKGNNRNQSAQRAQNRRASSGASYNRGLPFSPPLGAPSSDYFQLKGSLHEQLFQQYQYLQAQQDVLRTQLAHQQAQAQTRVGDLASSPRPRQFPNGLASPQHPPSTAPLPMSYLFPYPTRYPPPSPVSQARAREGTSTNPSSPSLVAAVPGLTSNMGRRQAQRASVPDGNVGSVRSQSQPGRSLPQHLALHPNVTPEVIALMNNQFLQHQRAAAQAYHQGHQGMQLPYGPYTAIPPGMDNPTPKEYVGYIHGMSPQLGPQQHAMANAMPPPMALRDPPLRQRRVTPDLMPPAVNGGHSSRSPSPLGHPRSFSTTADPHAVQSTVQSPTTYGQSVPTIAQTAPLPEVDLGGPLIVNGSNRGNAPRAVDRVNEIQPSGLHIQTDVGYGSQTLPFRERYDNASFDPSRRRSSPRLSPTSQAIAERIITPASATNGISNHVNGASHHHENTPLSAVGPLLSPVAELRTPSPTQSRNFDNQPSPKKDMSDFKKVAQVANAKQAQRESNGVHANDRVDSRQEERRRSMPAPPRPDAPAARGNTSHTPTQPNSNSNSWQQVGGGKKGHKKNNKSTNGPRANGSGGQPMPANESERKGG